MTLIALCMAFYSISGAYASISTLTLAPTIPIISGGTTNNYKTPMLPQPMPHAYGDPINDPRPKMVHVSPI